MSPVDCQWISRSEDFLALRHEWQALLADSSSDTLFMTWEWQYTWWQHLAEHRTLAILTVRLAGKLMAIAPMAIKPPDLKRMIPFRYLEILGTGNVGSDYLSIIVARGAEHAMMPAISAALLKRNFVLEISNTEHGSHVITMAALALNALGCRTARHTQSFSPYIDMAAFDWDSYMSRNNSASETRFNKKLRKLERTFSVRLEQTRLESTRTRDLQILIDLHLQRWDGKGGSNAFDSAALCSFHASFTETALQNNWLRLFILRLDDKPAAAVYGFFYHDVFYYYQAGFAPEFSQYSVGYLAIGLTVKKAFEEGAHEYDMLHGEEEYKYTWATSDRELVRLTIFPPTAKGRLCEQYLGLRNSAKALIMDNVPDNIRDRVFASA